MKPEDKELLYKDLCARLPYGVKVKVWLKDGTTEEGPLDLEHNYGDVLQDAFYYNRIKDIKPYLRPMSSMTDKELVEFYGIRGMNLKSWELESFRQGKTAIASLLSSYSRRIDFLNAHHLDYRGLIPKGLAIEVTEENNPYKE